MVLVVDDNEPCVVSLIWTIQNFIYCMQMEEKFIESPPCTMNGAKWRLRLYPRGCWVPGFLDFYLQLISKDKAVPLEVTCALSIGKSNGTFMKMEDKEFKFKSADTRGFAKLLIRSQIIENRHAYLVNDELIVRCRIWKCNYDQPAPLRCYVRTKVRVTKIFYMWNVDKFLNGGNKCISNRSADVQHNLKDIPSLSIEIITGGSCIEDIIHIMVKQIETNKPNLLVCKISLMDGNKTLSCSVEGQHCFEKSQGEQKWSLSFLPKRKLLARKDLYLTNNTLSLHFEFTFSLGVETSEVERLEYGFKQIQQIDKSNDVKGSDSVVEGWIGNLKNLCSDGKLHDVIIRTPNRDYPAHKGMLAAQSRKFSEIFDADSKEKSIDVVEINDYDDDTVSRMLLFIYTCSTNRLVWEVAVKLWHAAKAHRIESLQKMCFVFFRENITTRNACEILVLADTHEDEELKSVAQNFILEHYDEVFNSEEFKKLKENKETTYLTSETMHLYFEKSCNVVHHSKNS